MERIIRYHMASPHPEDHKPGHCDCSCFGRGFTVRVDDEGITAFGRLVSRDDTHAYIDWYELYRDGKEPENWHADPWPLTLFTEIIRERKGNGPT